jgi:hypothetical protein
MTRPSPPVDRELARDVAKQIDRRRIKRRLTLWSALLALISAAALYLRCGSGLGLGGGVGLGGDGDRASRPTAAVRCAIHVSADGISVGGRTTSRDDAVTGCKAAPGVDVFPTGDARHGDVEALRTALEAAGARAVVVHPPPRADRAPPRADRAPPRADRAPGEPRR